MEESERIPNSSQGDIETFLLNHNITLTRQRVAIAAQIFRKQQHLSADKILEQVNFNDIQVSKATVYNTLRLFVTNGLLREVAIDPQRTLFDTNTTDHHHILNTETGEIRDINPVAIDLLGIPGLGAEEQVDGIDLVLRVSASNSRNKNP